MLLFLLWAPVIILVMVSVVSFLIFVGIIAVSLATDATSELIAIAENVLFKTKVYSKKQAKRVAAQSKKGIRYGISTVNQLKDSRNGVLQANADKEVGKLDQGKKKQN